MKSLRIKFVGKDQPAPSHIIDGTTVFELPKDQSKPFDHPDARRILRVMPELYKPVTDKAGNAPAQSQPAADQSTETAS